MTDNKKKEGSEKIPEELPDEWRWWSGSFRAYSKGRPIPAKASLSIIKRQSLRANLHVILYKKGRWPFFSKKREELSIQIPLRLLLDAASMIEKSSSRARKQKKHGWATRFFKIEGRE